MKLIRAFVFDTWVVPSLFYLNPLFQASGHLVWLYSPVCVRPGQKPRRPVFSQRGSNDTNFLPEKFGNRDYLLAIESATMDEDAEYSVLAKNIAGEVRSSAQLIVEPTNKPGKTNCGWK